MADDLTDQIKEAVEEPAAASQDGRSATNRPIADLIAADNHIAAKKAASKGLGGVIRQQLKPPSALG